MRSFRLLLIFLVIHYGKAYGQSYPQHDSLRFTYLPRHVIKVSPLHLINFYPSVQIAYERHIKNNISLQLDVGYVFHTNYNLKFQNTRGTKLKTEIRYYLNGMVTRAYANYLSAEPYANIINFDREISQTECFDLDCTIQYWRWYNFKVRYREQGLSFKYGYYRYRGKIIMDLNFGLMLRNVDYKKPEIPRGVDQPDEWQWFEIPKEDKRITIGPVAGIRFGYRIE